MSTHREQPALQQAIEDIRTLPRFQSYNGRSWALVDLLRKLREAAGERGAPVDL